MTERIIVCEIVGSRIGLKVYLTCLDSADSPNHPTLVSQLLKISSSFVPPPPEVLAIP
jgi:hypothetical protein